VEEKHDLRRSILAFQFKKCKHMDQKTIVKCVEHRRTLKVRNLQTNDYHNMAEKLLTRHSTTITHSIVQYSIKSIRYIYDERNMYGFDYFITLMENINAAQFSN
jgi:hypothetical protein